MIDEFLAVWDEELETPNSDKTKLYEELLKKFQETDKKNIDICWRLVRVAIAAADSFEKVKNLKESKKFIEISFEHAKKAIELDPNSMQAHKWYCASVGRMAPLVSAKERINMGYQFKEHRDIAVKIDSNDKLMHHMYGRWCYEVASLSYIERKLAETFLASPPKSTYEEALESFVLADKLWPDWKMNHLWMAKAYVALKQYDKAIKWIDSGLKFPNNSEEDCVSHIELNSLEKTYSKYRKC